MSDEEDNSSGSDYNQTAENDTSGRKSVDVDAENELKRQKIAALITECRNQGGSCVSLDLSRCGVRDLSDVLQLKQLQCLYLEENDISTLPENFFDCLPNLVWLDLRRNNLVSLPSFYLGELTQLRTLLLEDNQLSSLPLELGFVQSLDGLNIRNNPLEFPPEEIIVKGVKVILKFLRTVLYEKTNGDGQLDMKELIQQFCAEAESQNGNRNRVTSSGSAKSIRKVRELEFNDDENLGNLPGLQSAGIQRSASSVHRRGNKAKKKSLKQAVKTQSEKYLDPHSEKAVTDDQVQDKYLEERRLAKLKKQNIKEDGILQGRRDQETVKNWREEAKVLQQKKNTEKRIKGKLEYDEPATKAPYGIFNGDLKVMTNEERLANDPNKVISVNKPLEREEVLRLEEAKRQQEHVLIAKIKDHTRSMLERRLNPLENPHMEMEAALRDFEIAEKLQQEIELRRKQLEYGFAAPSADISSLKPDKKPADNKKH